MHALLGGDAQTGRILLPRPDPALRCMQRKRNPGKRRTGIKSLVGFPNAIMVSGSKTKRPNSRLPSTGLGWPAGRLGFGSIHRFHPIPIQGRHCGRPCMQTGMLALPWPHHTPHLAHRYSCSPITARVHGRACSSSSSQARHQLKVQTWVHQPTHACMQNSSGASFQP